MKDQYGGSIWEINIENQYRRSIWRGFSVGGILLWGGFFYGGDFSMGGQYGGSIWGINMENQYGGDFSMRGIFLWRIIMGEILLWGEFCYGGNFAMGGILLWGECCYERDQYEECWIVWGYSGAAHETEAVPAYVIFRLLILNEPTQALSSRRNSEILIYAHKSLLINDKWKKRKKNKIYENFENKKNKIFI